MEKQFKKKMIWVLKNFPSLRFSDVYVAGGCKWKFSAFPIGNDDYLSLYVGAASHASLPVGWRRHAKGCFVLVNQRSENLSKRSEFQGWFDKKSTIRRLNSMFPLSEIHAKESGFLVNGELKIVVEIDVLEVIGKLDVSEETSPIVKTMEVHGFEVLPSQAKYVSRMFERHPEIASDFRPQNPNLRTGYMSLLLSLIETMCQLPQEISRDDLSDAYVALGSMRHAGFKLDWLEKKLDEVSEIKKSEEDSVIELQEMEARLKFLKLKSLASEAEVLAMEALVDMKKEKGKVSVAKAPISFDDVV